MGLPIGLQMVGRHRDDLGLLITEDTKGTGSKRRNEETKLTEGRRTTGQRSGWLCQPSVARLVG
jgi:hypothetical protein